MQKSRWLAVFMGIMNILPVFSEKTDELQMTALLASPPKKLLYCAKQKGSLPYQTALSLNYFLGRSNLPENKVEAYAWSLIVGHRLQTAGNEKRLALHRQVENLLRQQIQDPAILKQGKARAIVLWQKYSKQWKNKASALCSS